MEKREKAMTEATIKKVMVVIGLAIAIILTAAEYRLINNIGVLLVSAILYVSFSLMLMMDIHYVCTDQCRYYHSLEIGQDISIIALVMFGGLTFSGKNPQHLWFYIPMFIIAFLSTISFLRLTINHPNTFIDE